MTQAQRSAIKIGLHILAVLVAIRLISDFMETNNEGRYQALARRFAALLVYTNEITDQAGSKNLFIGYSDWHFFLDPFKYDEELKARGVERTSYNLSFQGVIGSALFTFLTRLESEYMPAKFDTIYLELSPLTLSADYHARWGEELDDSLSAIFNSPRMMADMIVHNAPAGMHMLFNQTVRPFNWRYFQAVSVLFAAAYRPAFNMEQPGIVRLWTKHELHEIPEWRMETRGLNNWNLPRTQSLFDQLVADLHKPVTWLEVVEGYRLVHGADFRFKLDPTETDMFIRSAEVAKRMAKNVYLVTFPYTPSLQKESDRWANWPAMKDKFEAATGLPILDFSHSLELNDDDFVDPMHPQRRTMNRLLALLAEEVANREKVQKPK